MAREERYISESGEKRIKIFFDNGSTIDEREITEPPIPKPTTQDIINASLLTSIQEIKVILGGGASV